MIRKLGLDLYCCAGGARIGYERAGFTMIGIDKDPQPHYQGPFILGDALDILTGLLLGYSFFTSSADVPVIRFKDFAFIHASPPCQLFCMYRNLKSVRESTDASYVNMIPDTRRLLEATGLPWVMENVVPRGWKSAPPPDFLDPAATIQLCGTSFGIPVRRHRLFELGGWKVEDVPPCAHWMFTERRFPGSSNRPNGRTVCNVGEWRVPLPVQKECMTLGVDSHFTLDEISEMIPPVMTEFLGLELLKHLKHLEAA